MTQKQAFTVLEKGRNAFITGPAGSGKTYLLEKFILASRKKGVKVAVTATTGLAATHLDGRTIHSWAGIGIEERLSSKLLDKIKKRKSLIEDIKSTDILIIDEISMFHGYRLDMVNEICKDIRKSDQSFGGIQVILSGDFFQLPPIIKNADNQLLNDHQFAFNSDTWAELKLIICYLDEQYRQDEKDDLNIILNALRSNTLNKTYIDRLKTRILKNPSNLTELYCHNENVNAVNQRRLQSIPGAEKVFKATSSTFLKDKAVLNSLIKNVMALEYLKLKVGALVMFIKNDSLGRYVNGTLAIIQRFNFKDGYPIVKTLNNKKINVTPETWKIINTETVELASFTQLPLKLAYAITVHKSQGMTLSGAYLDLRDTFEPGMGYVALSRLQSLDSLYLAGFNNIALQMNPYILEKDKLLRRESNRFSESFLKFNKVKKESIKF